MFLRDADLARKWIMASMTREACPTPNTDQEVTMLSLKDKFPCQGRAKRFKLRLLHDSNSNISSLLQRVVR